MHKDSRLCFYTLIIPPTAAGPYLLTIYFLNSGDYDIKGFIPANLHKIPHEYPYHLMDP